MYLAKAVRELVQYDVPAVGKCGAKILIQRAHLSVDDGVLILLHYAGECGFSRDEVGQFAMHPHQQLHALSFRPRIVAKSFSSKMTITG